MPDRSCRLLVSVFLAMLPFGGMPVAVAVAARPATASLSATPSESSIVAVVNTDVITRGDVTARGRLFAISTGLPVTPEVLDRLRPQITRQLIDERLRLQEAQRRHVIIDDKQIADAIREIEQRNSLPPGALRAKLAADGVGLRTLIDQIRVQLGWTDVLKQVLGDSAIISQADIDEQAAALAAEIGRPEYRLGEIFIANDDPSQAADARRFAETVAGELRSGAPFPVVAAQFSQSQTALAGGDLGWVQPNQLDPSVAAIAAQMPIGAISNPIPVPGGFSIVQLRAKRELGRESGTLLSIRQTFFPFPTPLDPHAPTAAQTAVVEHAKSVAAGVHSCDAMEAANQANASPRPSDPGPVQLEGVNPPNFRTLLASIPLDRTTPPLISPDGVVLIIVCSREQKTVATANRQAIADQLLSERIELTSRQFQRDLRRRAVIDQRTPAIAAAGG